MKRIKISVCVLCLVLCCGCWDKHELEDQTFVIMMGIDKADDKNIAVTVAFPLTQTESGENQGDGGDYSVMSAKAPTMAEALNMFSVKLAGPLALFSAKTVVISQELAEDDMMRHVFSSWRYEQMRNNTNVLISRCNAAEFINARLNNPEIAPLRQEDLILEQSNHSAYYKSVQFLDLIIGLKSNIADGVAMYGGVSAKKEDGDIEIKEPVKTGYIPGEFPVNADNISQICGLAVFRGDRMTGALNSSQAQTYAMMTTGNISKTMTLTDPIDPESDIVVSITPGGKSKIRGYLVKSEPVFDIEMNLRYTVECVQTDTDYTSGQNYDILTQHIRQSCEQSILELIQKIQKDYNADLLKLGDKLAKNFSTEKQWRDYNWPQRYKDAEIRVSINMEMERAGIFKH